MEHGRRASSTTDVILYVVVCGMTLPEAEPLLELTRRAMLRQGHYLSDRRIGGPLQSLIFHESSAAQSTIYEPQVIPGLLQTPEYARSLITAVHPRIAEDRLAGAVGTRMERQRILYLPNPTRLTFYIHEHALRLHVGTDSVMQEQLLHLVLTAALENVTVRVVPNVADDRCALVGSFRLMEFHEHRPIVFLDNLGGGGLILEDPAYVSSYRELEPVLADVALDEGQSRELAAELADAYDRGSQRDATHVVAEEQFQRRRGIGLPGSSLAQEQSQRRRGIELRGSGMVRPPSPIYE